MDHNQVDKSDAAFQASSIAAASFINTQHNETSYADI